MKFLVIGLGSMGKRRVRNLQALNEKEIVGFDPKIERAKELLLYDELNLTEISYRLNYSSVAHLSNQFKKITGLTPSHFKSLKDKRRSPIEEIGNVIS